MEDQQPLLTGDGSLLRRVVTRLQHRRSWRRWFTADESGSSESQPADSTQHYITPEDIETGSAPVNPVADEAVGGPASIVSSVRPLASAVQQSGGEPTSGCTVVELCPEIVPARADVEHVVSSGYVAEAHLHTPVQCEDAERSSGNGSSSSSSGSGSNATGLVATLGQLLGISNSSRSDGVGVCESAESDVEKQAAAGKALLRSLSRSSSSDSLPMCLICLEPLTAADFTSGEAMSLECQCRGEMALRHRTCAIKWSRVKGDVTCDVCKTQVYNLPVPPPRAASPLASDADGNVDEFADSHQHIGSDLRGVPGHADLMFDCIRVTWVAMIVCILFFEMNLTTALWSGIAAGLGYTLFVRAMVRNQLAAAAAAAESNRSIPGNSLSTASETAVVPPQPMLQHVLP